jgi:hypothetical protein
MQRNRSEFALKSLHNRGIAAQSQRNRSAGTTQAQRSHCTIVSKSRRKRSAIAAISLRNHCTIAAQLRHNRSAIVA